jgi:L-aspartate oxidase
MQFHPTTLYHPQMRSFLITEAVRGAGATLRNHLGRRFMYDYDPRLELAPRDIVARAIEAEMKRLGTWCVYLDLTHLKPENIKHEFPTIYERLASIGLEIDKDWIPVVPAQHYSCGGVATDLNGMTSVPQLFAAGEVACTGVHGANRLASNSLLEALVFAASAADATKNVRAVAEESSVSSTGYQCISESESIHLRQTLRKTMTERVGIVRSDGGLSSAKKRLADLIKKFGEAAPAPFSRHPLETHNLLIAAQHVVQGAIDRKVNVGLHYNVDQE